MARKRSRTSGCVAPKMLAMASRAALVAPALPMASVPTGMLGIYIWTIESRESTPFKMLLLIGTPSTGSNV